MQGRNRRLKAKKVKEVMVVPQADGLLVVGYQDGDRTQQMLLSKEQALFLASELMNMLYKTGYRR